MPRQRGHASREGLRSEQDAVSMVKHGENETSATKTTKQHCKIDFSDVRCSFSLFFMPKRRKNEPIDPGDLVHGLQLGTSPTRAGGQDDGSFTNSLKRTVWNSLPDPADQVSETAARTYLPHAPGVRMTVVKLTPSNRICFRMCCFCYTVV